MIETDIAVKFHMVIVEAGFEPRSYSGRGMNNKQCVGFTIDRYASELDAGYRLAKAVEILFTGDQEMDFIVDSVKSDSLCYDTIIYFPTCQFVPEEQRDIE